MSKEAVFTMKLEPELRAREDRPASQIVRELMRDYIAQRQEAPGYDEYLWTKVEGARASMKEGRGLPNHEVESMFALRRARASRGEA